MLLETVRSVAQQGGRPLRLIDLSGQGMSFAPGELRALADAAIAEGSGLLCAVPDPSPGLHWLPEEHRSWLQEIFGAPEVRHLQLRPLDPGAYIEIVTDSLGAGGAQAEDLARVLHTRTHADLRASAEGFRTLASRSCYARGLAWRLDPERFREARLRWAPDLPDPRFDQVIEPLRAALQICARAGSSLPAGVARRLVQRFAAERDLEGLVDHGYLLPTDTGRLAFVTSALWGEVVSLPHPTSDEIDRWLHEHLEPDPRNIGETLRACDRARRQGDPDRERQRLIAAYQAARDERRWHDFRRLFARPDLMPVEVDLAWARGQARRLAGFLGEGWHPAKLLFDFGCSLMSQNPLQGAVILEAVARGDHAPASTVAMVRLLESALNRGDEAALQHYLAELAERERTGKAPPVPGVLDYYRALHALTRGAEEETERYARPAAEKLSGSGVLQEGLVLQMMAVRAFERDPQRGIALMRAALDRTQEWERQAQIRRNLCSMYQRIGDETSAVTCADEGIARLRDRITPARYATLHLRRAWSWWSLGRHAEATRSARDLLELGVVRRNGMLNTGARLLLGHGHLHHRSSPVAISEIARAWSESSSGCPIHLRSDALACLCDALLDLEAWETVRDHGASLEMTEGRENAQVRLATARADAMRAQAAAKPREAVRIIEGAAQAAVEVVSRVLRSRYCHHLGCARLASALTSVGERREFAAAAAEALDKAIAVLPADCYVYYRGRSRQRLAQAHALLGRNDRAGELLTETIASARAAECQGLLKDCLRQKSALSLESAGDRTNA